MNMSGIPQMGSYSSSSSSSNASTSSASNRSLFHPHQDSRPQDIPYDQSPDYQSRSYQSESPYQPQGHHSFHHQRAIRPAVPTYDLRHELQQLREENLVLRTENATLKSNFNSLLAVIAAQTPSSSNAPSLHAASPSLAPITPSLVILLEEDYPEATYWQKDLWTSQVQRDSGKTAAEGVALATKNGLLFITTQDGEPPSKPRIEKIRAYCYKLYFQFLSEDLLPRVWSEATLIVQQRFRAHTEAEFPDLRLCDDHWKADRLAGIVFNSWSGTHRKGDKKIKTEPAQLELKLDTDSDSVAIVGKKKRPHSEASLDVNPAKFKKSKTVTPPVESVATSQPEPASKTKVPRRKNPLQGMTPAPSHLDTNATADCISSTTQPASEATVPSTSTSSLATSTAAIPTAVSSDISSTSLEPGASASDTAASPSITSPAPRSAAPTSALATTPESVTEAVTQSTSAPKKKSKKWNPSADSTTERGMCAYDYHQDHKDATKADFDEYFINLTAAEKKTWKDRAKAAKAAKTQAAEPPA